MLNNPEDGGWCWCLRAAGGKSKIKSKCLRGAARHGPQQKAGGRRSIRPRKGSDSVQESFVMPGRATAGTGREELSVRPFGKRSSLVCKASS